MTMKPAMPASPRTRRCFPFFGAHRWPAKVIAPAKAAWPRSPSVVVPDVRCYQDHPGPRSIRYCMWSITVDILPLPCWCCGRMWLQDIDSWFQIVITCHHQGWCWADGGQQSTRSVAWLNSHYGKRCPRCIGNAHGVITGHTLSH